MIPAVLRAVMTSATRSALAAIVRQGLVPPLEGKNDATTTYRGSRPWARLVTCRRCRCDRQIWRESPHLFYR